MDGTAHDLQLFGSRVRYWEYGTPASGPTLVLVHGYRGDHHGLELVVAQLSGFHVISPDLPAYGQSEEMIDAHHTVDDYGRWLRAFLEELGLTGSILLGHSFGSIVVAHAVAEGLPARAVILVNPIASDPAKVGGITFIRLYNRIGRVLPERIARRWLSGWIFVRIMSWKLTKTQSRELRKFIHAQHHAYFSSFASRRSVIEGFRASLSKTVTAAAARIAQPVLLVAGKRDEIAPIEAQRTLKVTFPDARLIEIPEVGHLIHYETPETAADAIRAFVAELGA